MSDAVVVRLVISVPHMEQPRQEAITVMFEYYICNNIQNSAHTSSLFSSHKATCLDFSCWLLWRIIWRQVPAWQCCPVIMNYNGSRHNLETSPLSTSICHTFNDAATLTIFICWAHSSKLNLMSMSKVIWNNVTDWL